MPEAQGGLPPGPHVQYVLGTRTSLGRWGVRTAYCGTPGDDTMKKTIGEAMLKSRSGEAGKSPSSVPGMDDLDMGGF